MNAEIKSVKLDYNMPIAGSQRVKATFELIVKNSRVDFVSMPISFWIRVDEANDMSAALRAALNELDQVLKQAAQ